MFSILRYVFLLVVTKVGEGKLMGNAIDESHGYSVGLPVFASMGQASVLEYSGVW